MHCLWITLSDTEPQHNGQFVYSGGLIGSFSAAGTDVEVLGLRREEAVHLDGEREGRVVWNLARHMPRSPWVSLCSSLPNMASRCATAEMLGRLQRMLKGGSWDVIVIDGISVGWAAAQIVKRYPDRRDRPKIVYISHNHETSLRLQLARNQPELLKRRALILDAWKVGNLECKVLEIADLVTAITCEDRDLYRTDWPNKPIEVLTPGHHLSKSIAASARNTPRRAVVVGSFDWVAKRMNIEEFIRAADSIFAANNIELQIVGSGDENFFKSMRKQVVATTFTGTVPSTEIYMREARLALVPERSGGGFKLKVLDYVFNRLPILALHGSVAGVPLRNQESILLYSNHADLAMGVVRMMDDRKQLDQLQQAAFNACSGRFDWGTRGRDLMSAIGTI